MLPDRVSNPGPLTYESGVLPIALRGPATPHEKGSENEIGRVDVSESIPTHLCLITLNVNCYYFK